MSIPLRVLIVDDSDDEAMRVVGALRSGGYAPDWRRVTTAAALTDAAGEADWDVITCDDIMSGFDGMEAILIARSAAPHIPVIAVARDSGATRSALLVKLGAFACVSKQELSGLPHAVASALARR